MIILKTERDLEAMRPACAVASAVLNDVARFIQPGLTTLEVDEFAASRMKHYGAKSAFFGYRKYPCQICISVNDEVVHGLAGVEIQHEDPDKAAASWAKILNLPVEDNIIRLEGTLDGSQVRFVPIVDTRGPGVSAYDVRAVDRERILRQEAAEQLERGCDAAALVAAQVQDQRGRALRVQLVQSAIEVVEEDRPIRQRAERGDELVQPQVAGTAGQQA